MCIYNRDKTGGLISFYPPFSKSHVLRCLNSSPSLNRVNTQGSTNPQATQVCCTNAVTPCIPVTHTKESWWMVPSQTDGSIEYTIRLINKTCYCKLSCTHCRACVHTYTCTCMDATLHATVCKHVHLVQMTTTNTACKD